MGATRRIMTFNRVTADGYFAGADGNLDWVVPDDEIDKAGAQATSRFDTVLFGRRTYQQFEAFWPHALDDSATAPDPHAARRRSPETGRRAGQSGRRPSRQRPGRRSARGPSRLTGSLCQTMCLRRSATTRRARTRMNAVVRSSVRNPATSWRHSLCRIRPRTSVDDGS